MYITKLTKLITILPYLFPCTGKYLSMGYGFVEFLKKESAMKALKELQHTDLDGHMVELKVSNRTTLV